MNRVTSMSKFVSVMRKIQLLVSVYKIIFIIMMAVNDNCNNYYDHDKGDDDSNNNDRNYNGNECARELKQHTSNLFCILHTT